MERLILKQIIFETEKGTNKIYEAVCDDKECYCIEHTGTGVKVLINHSEELLDKIIQKIKRASALTVEPKRHGYVIKFPRSKRTKSLSLRLYVYAYYHNLPIDKVKGHRIALLDDSLLSDNILDFRKDNLFNMGGYRADGIEVVVRPGNPTEKYITVTENGKTEIQDYSDDLYEILTTRSLSVIQNPRADRHKIEIHCTRGRNGYTICNLSRFIAIYNEYREQYILLRNFIRNTSRLLDEFRRKNIVGGHISSSCRWNNTKHNLMFMKSDTNGKMSDYISEFVGEYEAFPIVIYENEKRIILVRLLNHGNELWYKCATPEHYCNLQLTLYGANKLTQGLKINVQHEEECPYSVETPKQTHERTEQNDKKEYSLSEFWKWCDMRDNILRMYQEAPHIFKEWTGDSESTSLNTVVNEILPFFVAPFRTEPLQGYIITECVKQGDRTP